MNAALFDARLIARLQTLSRLAAIVAIGVGCMVIIGWLFNIELFMSIYPGLVAMKFNTAIGFILAGVALLSVRRHPRLAQFLAAFIILLGLLTVCEYAFGWNLGIDQLFIRDPITPTNHFPGRMSPIAAINFCLIGTSLLLFIRTRRFALAQSLTLVAGFMSLLALAGYLYGVQPLYQISMFSSIALHTTITFLVLCVAIFFIEPEQDFAGKILINRAGGLLARRLIPGVILISLILGWLRLKGQEAGYYDTQFGVALLVMSTIIVFIVLVYWAARSLNRIDARRAEEEAQRQQADEAIARYTLRLAMLHEIDRGILEAGSIATVIEVALTHLRQLVPCQRVDVTLLDEATGEAVIFAVGIEGETKLGKGVRIPVPPDVFEGYDARHIRIFADIRLFQETKPRAKQLIKEGLLSALSVLLMDRERPIGTLGLFAATPDFFTAEHQEIVVEVANQVAIAINQLRLSEELARRAAELEQRVTELIEARVEERTSELSDMNTALQEVLIQRKLAEDQFRALLESAPDAMIITNPDGDIQLINAQTEKFFGYSHAELAGLPIEMLIPERFRSLHPANGADALHERNTGMGLELYGLRKDGSQFPIEISISPIETEGGLLVASAIRDVTERKLAEEALKMRIAEEHEFQDYLKALHEVTIELTTISDLDAFYKRAVELGRQRLGFDRLGLLLYDAEHSLATGTYGTDGSGNLVSEHHLRFDPGGLTGILMRALEKEEHFVLEEDAQLLDDHKPMSRGWNAAAVLWNGTEKLGWLAVDNGVQHKPISKPLLNVLSLYALTLGTLLGQKRTQAAVQESERRLNLLAQNSPDIIYVIDLSMGEMSYLNRPGFLGYSQSEIQRPESLLSAVHPDDNPRLLAHWGEGLIGGKLKQGMIEYRLKDKQGEWQWIQSREMIFSAAPDGTPTQILVTLTVITGRKQAEQQAVELQHERERVKMLSDFVTNMSHDFRTPLTIMSTNLYLMSRITEPEKQKSYLASTEQQILSLTRLIDRQLTMVRLDSQTTVALQPLDVNLIASNLGFIIGSEAKPKNITIVSVICEGRLMVQGHPDDLSMAFAELGKNAVRYTPDNGTVTIHTRRENNQAVIEVSDTGIGIAEGDWDRIFQRLYRIDGSRSSQTGGTGLGLPIAKRIIELHQGTISVESVEGEGSTFRVLLPLSE